MLSYADALANTGCENVEMAVLKQIILFAGLVARMDNKRLHKRTVFGEPEGGKGYLGGQEQDWMGCLESDLQLFNWPIDIRGNRKKKEKGGNKKKNERKTKQHMLSGRRTGLEGKIVAATISPKI